MIKVIIIDDQLIVREGIKFILEQDSDIKVLDCGGNGREALKLCNLHHPDLVLMDIKMPICDGIQGVQLIKEVYKSIKILMLTTYADDETVSKAIANGADGYILKDIKPEELIQTVKACSMGINVMHRDIYSSVRMHMGKSKALKFEKPKTDLKLTQREIEVVKLIVDGKDAKEIASTLFLTEGSVRNMISSMLKKLNLRDKVQLAVFAVKNDLV